MFPIRTGMVIRHKMFRDVAFSVSRCFDCGSRYEIKGFWINLGFEHSWIIDKAKIDIEKADVHDWLYCGDNEAKCLRYENWLKL